MVNTILDTTFKIPSLKGRDNYPVWKIQMEDIYRETDLWTYIANTTTRPVLHPGAAATQQAAAIPTVTQEDIDAWDKKKRQALGLLRRRVEEGPMVHVATATEPHIAWQTLERMYEQVGTTAMTLLRQKFYGNRMAESDDLEEHIKTMRKLFDQINLALSTQRAQTITEVEYIEQLVASLPESYDIIVSTIDFAFDAANDPQGVRMSQNIQTRLLNKAARRHTRNGNKPISLYTSQCCDCCRCRRRRSRDEPDEPDNHRTPTCYNCGKPGHKKSDCWCKGGGAYRSRDDESEDENNNRTESKREDEEVDRKGKRRTRRKGKEHAHIVKTPRNISKLAYHVCDQEEIERKPTVSPYRKSQTPWSVNRPKTVPKRIQAEDLLASNRLTRNKSTTSDSNEVTLFIEGEHATTTDAFETILPLIESQVDIGDNTELLIEPQDQGESYTLIQESKGENAPIEPNRALLGLMYILIAAYIAYIVVIKTISSLVDLFVNQIAVFTRILPAYMDAIVHITPIKVVVALTSISLIFIRYSKAESFIIYHYATALERLKHYGYIDYNQYTFRFHIPTDHTLADHPDRHKYANVHDTLEPGENAWRCTVEGECYGVLVSK